MEGIGKRGDREGRGYGKEGIGKGRDREGRG